MCRCRQVSLPSGVAPPAPNTVDAALDAAPPPLTPLVGIGLPRAPSRGRSLVVLEDSPRPHPLDQREEVVPSRAAADTPRLAHLRRTVRADMIYSYTDLLHVVRSIETADMHRLGLTSGHALSIGLKSASLYPAPRTTCVCPFEIARGPSREAIARGGRRP